MIDRVKQRAVIAKMQENAQPTVSALNGMTPTTYDKNWQLYTDLTANDIAWYMAQPEWQNFVAWVALDPPNATIHANAPDMTTIMAALTAASVTIATQPLSMPPTVSPPARGAAAPLSPAKPL